MICVVALITFSVLGIFNLRFRRLSYEAFECVLRRLTLQPCETRLDERIKSKIMGKILPRSPFLARLLDRYLIEVLSWIFVVTFFVSLLIAVNSLYNLVRFGSCSPQNPTSCPINNLNRQAP